MHASTLLLALASVASASPLTHSLTGRNNDGAPVVDLGKAGKYRGIVQNNGTVEVNNRLCDHIQLLIRFYSLGKAFHTLKLVSSVLHREATIPNVCFSLRLANYATKVLKRCKLNLTKCRMYQTMH